MIETSIYSICVILTWQKLLTGIKQMFLLSREPNFKDLCVRIICPQLPFSYSSLTQFPVLRYAVCTMTPLRLTHRTPR